MNSNLNNLLEDVKNLKKTVRKLNYRVNVLYQTQREEKVVQGYEKWRLSPEGGIKFVKKQLAILHYKCPVCHNPLTEKSTTIDHLHPKSKYLGMAVDENNMLILCNSCNAAKNNQEFEAWYSKLPLVWQERIDQAIIEIHGTVKLAELLPSQFRNK